MVSAVITQLQGRQINPTSVRLRRLIGGKNLTPQCPCPPNSDGYLVCTVNWRHNVAALERSHSPPGRLMAQRMSPKHQGINVKSGDYHHGTLTVH